jgi:hypothetical protein
VTIPDSVRRIKRAAFSGNPLSSVYIGNSVTSIEDLAFINDYGTNDQLTSVTFARSGASIGVAFMGDLHRKYEAGGAGTYTRPNGSSSTWTKQ